MRCLSDCSSDVSSSDLYRHVGGRGEHCDTVVERVSSQRKPAFDGVWIAAFACFGRIRGKCAHRWPLAPSAATPEKPLGGLSEFSTRTPAVTHSASNHGGCEPC